MAPEVIERKATTYACDIWYATEIFLIFDARMDLTDRESHILIYYRSLGCTIIELIDGKPPYADSEPMPALFRMLHDKHPPIPTDISTVSFRNSEVYDDVGTL